MNSSQNLPIYWFVGTGFKTTMKKHLRSVEKVTVQRRNMDEKKEEAKKAIAVPAISHF